jgi:exosortase E/protease (VPEID-CTERM system)
VLAGGSPRPLAHRGSLPLALLLLLVAEVLYLTIGFDSWRLDRTASPWTTALGLSPQVLRIAIAVAVVALLLSGRDEGPAVPPGLPRSIAWPAIWTGVHLLAFLQFVRLTTRIFDVDAGVAVQPGPFVVAWIATGAVTLAAWALALRPSAEWWQSVLRHRTVLLCSVVLGTATWAGGFLAERLWRPLAQGTFAIVGATLGLFSSHVSADAARLAIGTPAFRVTIAPECSGYEGMGLIAAFLGIYLWVARRELRFPGALLLLPAGVALIWILNAVRLVLLIAIGSAGYRAIAAGGFHSQAGWITFNAVGLAIVWLVQRRGYFARADTREPASGPRANAADDPTIPLLAPLTAALAAAMVTGAMTAGPDWLYPVRVVVAASVLWAFRGRYRGLGWSPSWMAAGIGVATFAMWIVLVPTDPVRDHLPVPAASLPPALSLLWLSTRVIGYVLVTPLVEELAFRAYIMRRLVDPEVARVPLGSFTWMSFVVSSLIFGAFHGSAWLPAALAGMAFAVALYRRREIGDAVLAHAMTNGLIVLYVLFTGRWSMWS